MLLFLLFILPAFAWNYTAQTHRVVTYFGKYHTGAGGNVGPYTPLLPIIQNNSGITDVNLFVCDLHDTQPYLTIGGEAPNNMTWLGPNFWTDVAQVQAAGVNVLASFGGYSSNMFLLIEHDFDFYYPILRDFLKDYKLSGVDFDIEPSTNTLTSYAHGNTTLRLLKQLDKDFGSEFIITMAPVADDLTGQYNPQFFSGFNYNILDDLALDDQGNHIINWFNGQFYNGYGNCNNASTYNQTITYGGWDPSRVVFLVGSSNLVGGWCDIATLEQVVGELSDLYPTFGGVGGYNYLYAGMTDNITNLQWFQDLASAQGNKPAP